MGSDEELDSLKEEIRTRKGQSSDQEIKEVNILFLDVSSNCTGYTIAQVDFHTKRTKITKSGALWLSNKWNHEDKYAYIHSCITNYFWVVEGIDFIVVEQYSINPSRSMGVNVVPEMTGAIKAAAGEMGIVVDSFLPQSWRSELGIKKDKENNDYKVPTKTKILEYIKVPERSISNITGKERRTPFDVYDSLGVCIGWLRRKGFKDPKTTNCIFNSHLGILQ